MEEIKGCDYTSLQGKVALVTGASGGIGTEIAKIFHHKGAKVIGTGTRVKVDVSYMEYMQCDVVNAMACKFLFESIVESYGKIDILVNCAGITDDALSYKMSEEQFEKVINVNLKGVWNITRLVGPHMQKNHGGSIINVSSIVGIYGNIGQANYAATKAGLIGMTKSWAKEFSAKNGNVRVNAIAPGYTMTRMLETVPQNLLNNFMNQTMLGRLAEPEEIAKSILFLASDMSSYVTGTTLQVDGGMRL